MLQHLFEGLPDANPIVQAINDLRREQGMLPVDPSAAADGPAPVLLNGHKHAASAAAAAVEAAVAPPSPTHSSASRASQSSLKSALAPVAVTLPEKGVLRLDGAVCAHSAGPVLPQSVSRAQWTRLWRHHRRRCPAHLVRRRAASKLPWPVWPALFELVLAPDHAAHLQSSGNCPV